jgi:lactate dehydrogenase-like 2-hydroxyacid dehydrogenase
MRVGVFSTTTGGAARFVPGAKKYEGMEIVALEGRPSKENLRQLREKGCDAMIYNSDHREEEEFFREIAACGVKYVCCCSAGYDHFHIPAMKKYGLKGANVPVYSPNAISEHTVMLVLAALRKFRTQILRVESGRYRTEGLIGREIRNMTVGIVGAGRIGYTTMQCLSGFRPKKIYAYDPFPREAVREYAEYTTLEHLYQECDVIIYHTLYQEPNHHMVSRAAIEQMKDGVILVNVSRGGIADAEALLAGIESGKLGGVCLDVIEGEGILKTREAFAECPIPVLGKLLTHENVIFTPHTAFRTDEAEKNLIEGTLENLNAYRTCGTCRNELVEK